MRRRGVGMGGMGGYTLGDRYVTPDRRLSQMLMQQGSKGGPSNSWQETLGRIAQQLSGAYIGKLDQDNQDVAYQTRAKLEPTTYRPPTEEEAYKESPALRNLQALGQEKEIPGFDLLHELPPQPQSSDASSQIMGDPNDSYSDEQFEKDFSMEENPTEEPPRVGPRDYAQELAQGMGAYRGNEDNRITKQKMPQSEYSMQELRKLTDNPYAQRLLQGLMMQSADRDYASGLAETQFERKKEIAQLPMSQKQVQQKKDLLKPTRPKTVKTAKGVFILNDDGTLGNKLGDPHSDFMNPLDQAKLDKLKMDKIAANKESKSAQIKDQDALIALKRKTGMLDDTIERAKKNINWWSTGAPGTVSSLMPNETDRSNLDSDLLTLKANLGFDSLQQMRENSKTGGALGNVSENENLLLQAINGALDPKNRSQLEDNLDRIKALYPQVLKEKEDTYSRVYGEAYNPTDKNQKNAPPPPSGFEVVN